MTVVSEGGLSEEAEDGVSEGGVEMELEEEDGGAGGMENTLCVRRPEVRRSGGGALEGVSRRPLCEEL